MNSITNYITNNSNEFNFFITSLAGSDWVQTANNNQKVMMLHYRVSQKKVMPFVIQICRELLVVEI